MNYTKRIVCLATSRKPGGRCVAGLELAGANLGPWLRPVSARVSEEISLEERRFADGSEPQLLDIIDVPMIEPRPHTCQTENHLIDDQYYWTKTGRFDPARLLSLCEAPNPLWVNGFHSSQGMNDKVPENLSETLPRSLALVEPQELVLIVVPGVNKLQVRGEFRLASVLYNLVVTDLVVEAEFLRRGRGRYPYPGRVVACLSLAEPLHGFRYKLIASIVSV